MAKKKSTRPTSADQSSGAADPSLVSGAAESAIDNELDELTSELSSTSESENSPEKPAQKSSAPAEKPESASAGKPPSKTASPEPSPGPAEPAAPATPAESKKRPKLSPIELGALGLVALVILGFFVFLFTIPDDDLPSSDEIARPSEEIPASAAGGLVSLDSIDAYWRRLSATDRTDKSSDLIPELALGVSQKNTASPSFLKIHFIDPEGEISGDVRTARIEGGKLVDTGRGETVTGSNQLSVYGSKGIKDRNAFLAYRYSGEERWSIQIFEGADYSKGPWNLLANFILPDTLKGENPSD